MTISAALVTPWLSARLSDQRLAREAEGKKLESLEAVLDQAGLALEEVHWALRDGLPSWSVPSPSAPGRPAGAQEKARKRLSNAQADASRQGTRLAIRLGADSGSRRSPCVAAYDKKQKHYRALVRTVLDADDDSAFSPAVIQQELDELGDDQSYINEAAKLLRPASANRS